MRLWTDGCHADCYIPRNLSVGGKKWKYIIYILYIILFYIYIYIYYNFICNKLVRFMTFCTKFSLSKGNILRLTLMFGMYVLDLWGSGALPLISRLIVVKI